MIISKSNILALGTTALQAGTITSGSANNTLNSNFSKIVSSSSSTFRFAINATGSIQYVGLHGLSLPIGSVVTVTGGTVAQTFSASYTTTNNTKNIVFYVENPASVTSLTVQIVGSGAKVISYIQAGLASKIAWGVNSGTSLYYLGKTSQDRVTVSSRGMPTYRVQEETAPNLTVTIRNALKSWVRTDLQDIIAHYEQSNVLSILDFEDDVRPDESVAAFDLGVTAPTTHSQTTKLMDVSLKMKVSA